jgi:chemotaxis protein methyltransferase CheR
MNPATFRELCDVVYEQAGISLGPAKEALVSARVGKRLRALKLGSYEDYLELLKGGTHPDEIVNFVDVISTNVTSFFREPHHFEELSALLEGWARKGQTRFRIWSAASSSGEEPYTIAITASECLDLRRCDVKVLATDISTQILARACRGEYGAEKLNAIPAAMRDRYFTHVPANGHEAVYKVKDSLRRMVLFRRLNLSKPPFPLRGPLDVVFCRNVMIYFDNRVRSLLLDEIGRLLRPDGYLMVGHAESLTGMMSAFKSVRPSVYRKA